MLLFLVKSSTSIWAICKDHPLLLDYLGCGAWSRWSHGYGTRTTLYKSAIASRSRKSDTCRFWQQGHFSLLQQCIKKWHSFAFSYQCSHLGSKSKRTSGHVWYTTCTLQQICQEYSHHLGRTKCSWSSTMYHCAIIKQQEPWKGKVKHIYIIHHVYTNSSFIHVVIY